MHLSGLLGRVVVAGSGEHVAHLDDLIVRMRGEQYPLVTGLVAKVAGRQVFVAAARVADWGGERVVLTGTTLNLRGFERRDGELLLRADVLGNRLIDVTEAELVHAFDVEIEVTDEGLVVSHLDTRRPARFFGLLRQGAGHPRRDWKSFEPLIRYTLAHGAIGRVRKLKPAQIADLIEEADREEGEEILHQLHADPELEADVFEELEPDTAARLFAGRSDQEVAEILTRMRADDAADALADLPQKRRQVMLDALPLGHRTKVITLLGYNPNSAGGLMNVDILTVEVAISAGAAVDVVRAARSLQPEALNSIHAVDPEGRLAGVAPLVTVLQAEPEVALAGLLDDDPVRVAASTDIVDVALLMADFNLVTVPVVDAEDRLLGVITVDDVLEATIPEDWRRREPPARPESPEPDGEGSPTG